MATKKVKKQEQDSPTVSPREKLAALRERLSDAFVERESQVRALLIALLARQHVLLLGPPGTAKSALTRAFCAAIAGAFYFKRLLTKYSVPEELFGAYSMRGLKEDRYVRITRGKLPEAHVVFLDECFKANSAILNSLLTVLNEREFDNDGEAPDACPLITAVGASNEMPESKELDALFDRFMLRFWVHPLRDRASVKKMLMAPRVPVGEWFTLEELQSMHAEVDAVAVSETMADLILDVKDATEKGGFKSTDRRWDAIPGILQASAYLAGRDEVTEDDFEVLSDVLWNEPKDRPELVRVILKTANPAQAAAQEILDAAQETYAAIPFKGEVAESESGRVFQQIVDANTQFKASVDKLRALCNGKPNEPVQSVIDRITEMSQEASRFAAKLSGM